MRPFLKNLLDVFHLLRIAFTDEILPWTFHFSTASFAEQREIEECLRISDEFDTIISNFEDHYNERLLRFEQRSLEDPRPSSAQQQRHGNFQGLYLEMLFKKEELPKETIALCGYTMVREI